MLAVVLAVVLVRYRVRAWTCSTMKRARMRGCVIVAPAGATFIKRILKEAVMDIILKEMYGIWRLRSGGWILRFGCFIKRTDGILKEMYGF